MKVAVIGGSGFIGSHVVDTLLAGGHDVTVFDMMAPHRADVRHIFLDLLDFHRVAVALAGGYEAVYLLAAMANVDDIVKSPLESVLVNSQGVVNVLEALRRHGGRLIFSSTVWVYLLTPPGEGAPANLDETAPLCLENVNHIYTASKVAAELYIRSYQRLYGVEFTILRYGIPYGPRGRQGTVVTNFVERALQGKPLIIRGDGKQVRNFIYVGDLAEGSVAALQAEAKNKTFNLDGPREVTIAEVGETVTRLVGGSALRHEGERAGDFRGQAASNKRAMLELGWTPKTDLEDGIRKYIEWRRSMR
jgi:UDP-glucose 4-epimerase